MIIPQYWAEGVAKYRKKEKQITVRRFGWSDTSILEAQSNADRLANEALQKILAGEKLHKRDPKIAYNGGLGLPIREEIIARHEDVIITRNAYGAKCMNTPNVLFADIDFKDKSVFKSGFVIYCLLMCLFWFMGMFHHTFMLKLLVIISSIPISRFMAESIQSFKKKLKGGDLKMAKKKIEDFLLKNPRWSLRLYQTPAGLRIIATHQLFKPNEAIVGDFFKALDVDSVYAFMCLNQNCFRARLTPKPWRIGIKDHLRPRPGIWPVAEDRLPKRNEWLKIYDEKSVDFAACSFLETLGSGLINAEVRKVIDLHDQLSKANQKLPIA